MGLNNKYATIEEWLDSIERRLALVGLNNYNARLGGWKVGPNYLYYDSGQDESSSGMFPLDVPFYSGARLHNRADAPFRVTVGGALTATQADITGNITALTGTLGNLTVTGTLTVGTTDPRIAVDGVAKTIGTSNFASGVSGWRVAADGAAEFNNIVARGVIRTPVFLKDEVASIGGTFLVAASDALLADVTSGASFTFQAARGYFSVNDYLRIKPDAERDNWWKITNKSGSGPYTYTATLMSGSAATFRKGEAVVSYGPSGAGLVRLTASESYAPFVSVFTHSGSPWSVQTERVRLGKLDGITDPVFGALSGFGLWTDNVYLTGAINAGAGRIAGWDIGAASLSKNSVVLHSSGYLAVGTGDTDYARLDATDATYRLWVGSVAPGSAAFRVSKGGVLYATGATISGTLTANAGTIAGWTLSSTSLSKNNAVLHSGGYLALGTGNDYARLDALDATYRLWIGNTTPTSAPFRVTKTGLLTASGATIVGTITATAGAIGGWSLTASTMYSGNITLDATTPVITVSDGVYTRVAMGKIGTEFGFELRDALNNVIVSANGLGLNVVGTAQIQDAAITNAKVANLDAAKITTGYLSADRIAAGSITASKLSVAQLSAIAADMGSLTAGSIVIGTTNKLWLNDAGDGGLAIGGTDKANAPFRVTAAGALTATNASITGTITATTGSIGGWDIASSTISKNNATLHSSGYIVLGSGDNIVRLDATDATYRLWAGNAVAANAAFRVTAAGALTATNASITGTITSTAGSIGGWDISSTSISKNSATLHSGGYLLLGSGNDIVRLDALDATYRLWAGNATASSAPFRVSKTGAVTATAGSIGGWDLSSTTISKNNATLHSSGYLVLGTNNDIVRLDASDSTYRLWAGNATASSAPFRVTAQGAVTATNASITGSITATSGSLGTLDVTGTLSVGTSTPKILIDGSAKTIGTSDFASGTSGWRVASDGTAEFMNIIARGVIRTPVFLKDEVAAIGGTFLVAASDALLANVTSGASFTFQTRNGYFSINDYVRVKPDASRDNWWKITNKSGTGPYTYTASLQSGSAATFYAGEAVVSYGPSGMGLVRFTATETNAPFVSIFTHAGSPWSAQTERVRLGKLDGITDPTFGSLSGYGLWTDNAYLTGAIKSASGNIAGWDLSAAAFSKNGVTVHSSGYIALGTVDDDYARLDVTDATYRLWVGKLVAANAPFRVTKTGLLTATGADISGAIKALSGYFGNQTNGVLVDSTGLTISGTGYIRTAASGHRIELKGNTLSKYVTKATSGQAEFSYDCLYDTSGNTLGYFKLTNAYNAGGNYFYYNTLLNPPSASYQVAQIVYETAITGSAKNTLATSNTMTWNTIRAEHGQYYGGVYKRLCEITASVQDTVSTIAADFRGEISSFVVRRYKSSSTPYNLLTVGGASESDDVTVHYKLNVGTSAKVGNVGVTVSSGETRSEIDMSQHLPFGAFSTLPYDITASPVNVYSCTLHGTHRLKKWNQAAWVTTTNDASNYWKMYLRRWSDTLILATLTTASGSPNAQIFVSTTEFAQGEDTLVDTTHKMVYIQVEKVGSPGPLRIYGPAVYVE